MSRFIRLMGAAAFIAAAPFLEKAFGGGAPTFGSPQIITNAISAGSGNYMVMGDFDGDGIPDVAILGTADNTTAGSSAGVVEVHFGDGKNGFRSAAAIFANGTSGTEFGGNISPGMAAADLNGGGKSELIFPAGNAVLIYEWNGTSFSQTRSISLLGTGMSQAYAVAVGNLTTTNSRDIIVSDEFGAAGVVWIPNDGKGNFGTPVGFPIASIYAAPLTGTYRPLVLANVNGKNGLDDVILSWGNPISSTPGSAAGSTVGVLLNNGDGTLSREVSYGNPTLFAVPGLTINTFGLTVADVDGDGKLDLVSMCFTYDSLGAGKSYLSVNLGNGDGTFKDGKAFYIAAQGFSAMDAADLNGDGRVDIVTADNPVSEDGKFTVTEWTGTGDSLAVARQESYYGGDQYFNSLALGYKKANGQFVTFNNDIKVDVLLGTCLDLHDSYSEFAVFQNQTEKNVPAAMASFSATGPSGPGAAITFDATTLAGWSVYVQSNTNAANAGSWTDLPAPNGGQMVESTTHRTNYSLVSAAYPNGSGIAFRAVASKTGYTDIISGALGGFKLAQAVLSISVKLTSTSDPVHGSVTYLGDNLVYTFIVINSGSAAANNLQV
ncbi:MAG: VCBS repeat-containing protein, partial [Verrucomicrobiota bacterium]